MSRDDDRFLIEERRLEVERKLERLRESIQREVGFLPKAPYLLLGLTAGALGLSLALRRGSKRKKLKRSAARGKSQARARASASSSGKGRQIKAQE